MDSSGSGLKAARLMKASKKMKKGRERLDEIANRNQDVQPEWNGLRNNFSEMKLTEAEIVRYSMP